MAVNGFVVENYWVFWYLSDMHNKLESYDKAMKELMLLAMDYEVPQIGKFSLEEMVFLLRESFKYKLTYKKVFGEVLESNCDPATGFCLVSSYYIYEKTGGDKIWTLMKNPLHWWLQHKVYYGPFDITYTQFDTPFPYYTGLPEQRIYTDKEFLKIVKEKAFLLGQQAGLE